MCWCLVQLSLVHPMNPPLCFDHFSYYLFFILLLLLHCHHALIARIELYFALFPFLESKLICCNIVTIAIAELTQKFLFAVENMSHIDKLRILLPCRDWYWFLFGSAGFETIINLFKFIKNKIHN